MHMLKKFARLGAAAAATIGVMGLAHAQDTMPKTAEEAGGMETLIAKAKEEGSVLFYGAPSQDKMAAWTSGFTEKYGIPVQYYRAPSNQVYQRFSQEQQVGKNQADVMAISLLDLVKDAVAKDYVADYTPGTADKFPVDATIPGRSYPMYAAVQSIGWNTRVVPEDLQEKLAEDPFGALLDPRLKGKIAIVSVTAGGPQIAAAANLVYNQSDTYGWEYLEKLAAQDPAIVKSTTTLIDAIIAGDYWATPDGNPSVLAPKIVDGAPLAFALPKIASATQFNLFLANNAQHPNAGRLFMEWATSLEAQSEVANIAQSDVTIAGWKDEREITKQSWFKPADELWFGANNMEEVQGDKRTEFYAKWQDLFGL